MTLPRAGDDPRRSVFVTVGTDHHPFDRLVGWAEGWLERHAEIDSFIQYGTSRRAAVDGAAYLDQDQMLAHLRSADVVVCHGGPGTIMACLDAGKKPVVAARRSALGEHVDDHQIRFTARLGASGLVVLAETEEGFAALMDDAIAGRLDLGAPPRGERLESTVKRVAQLLDPLLFG